ncbi:hypothetical protein ACMFMF_007828 [Clarireedia jacksonii]
MYFPHSVPFSQLGVVEELWQVEIFGIGGQISCISRHHVQPNKQKDGESTANRCDMKRSKMHVYLDELGTPKTCEEGYPATSRFSSPLQRVESMNKGAQW